jgi:hypothetical protein
MSGARGAEKRCLKSASMEHAPYNTDATQCNIWNVCKLKDDKG